MANSFYGILLVLSCIVTGCDDATRFQSGDASEMKAYITNPENGLLKSIQVAPFNVAVQYLPSIYLQRVQNPHDTTSVADDKTATFQLRLTSLQGVSLSRLLQQQASAGWTAAQQQHALLYGFDQVCMLQLGNTIVKPLFATVEMTAQTQRELSVVLVFPLTTRQLRNQPSIRFTLAPTYFLKQPLTFSYETASLLAVSRQPDHASI